MAIQRDTNMLREEAADLLSAAIGPDFSEKRLVVGVSGGPDSLALLHLLGVGGPDAPPLSPPGHLVVGHLDHGLRPASAADARFVARLCAEWGIRCVVETADVTGLARAESLSLEEAGRRARYAFLARLARTEASPAVAVAHHARDQAETVLLHLLRGSGLRGLGGMAPISALPVPGADPPILLLRPLLHSTRAAIEAYCEANGLQPIADASNEDVTFLRNRVRHELLPELADYNPRIVAKLGETAAIAAADDALLREMADQAWRRLQQGNGEGWLALELSGWRALPLSLRRRTLRHAVAHLRGSTRDIGFRALEQARAVAESGEVGAQAPLPGGLTLTVGYERWRLARPGAGPPVTWPQVPAGGPFRLVVPGRLPLENGWVLNAAWRDELPPAVAEDRWRAAIDGRFAADLVVRGRQPGERFQPLGMAGRRKKVKELMIDAKIPAAARARWPLVAGPDHLLWIAGRHLDRRARATDETVRVVELRCMRQEN